MKYVDSLSELTPFKLSHCNSKVLQGMNIMGCVMGEIQGEKASRYNCGGIRTPKDDVPL